jgi:phosphate transport system substrate-binding protein
MVQKGVLTVGLVTLLLVGVGLSASATTVKMAGSTTVLPIAQAVAETLANKYDIEVSGGGSSVGIASLLDGTTDIADHSRPIKPSEYKKAVENGIYPFTFHIANDAVAVIVHPSNPVNNLTLAQLKDIYTGKITDWKQVGGKDAPIAVVSRDSSSGTFETWEKIVMKGEPVTSNAIFTTSNADVANEISRNPNAIGYVGLAYVSPQLKAVRVNGMKATMEAAINYTYPIVRPLFMSTNGFPAPGPVRDVILFILSDAGQKIVKEEGYAPIRQLP